MAPLRALNYDSLRDVVYYASAGGFAATSDIRVGCHAILIPRLTPFYGFERQGVVYVWLCMPYDSAPACRIFTEVTSVFFQPLRDLGVHLTQYLDDRLACHESRAVAKAENLLIRNLLAALGWYVSLDTCDLLPVQLLRFLGLTIDFVRGVFSVPANKLAAILTPTRRGHCKPR